MPHRSELDPRSGQLVVRVPARRPARRAERTLESLAARRSRIVIALTATMLVVYFGFILLIAFARDFLGRTVTEGLSLGMLLGVLVVLATWVCTWIYVRWANRVYEPELERLRR